MMRRARFSPAIRLTRSQCRPAQFTRNPVWKSPAVVSTTQPSTVDRKARTRAPVITRPPPRSISRTSAAHLRVIPDELLWHSPSGESTHMRLDLPHSLAAEPFQPFQAVLLPALVESPQPRDLPLVRRHHQLAANFVRDAALLTERHHLPDARHRQPRPHGPWLVVQAAMQYAAVVPGLMPAHRSLFFEDSHPATRQLFSQAVGRGQPHDSSADDPDVHLIVTSCQPGSETFVR